MNITGLNSQFTPDAGWERCYTTEGEIKTIHLLEVVGLQKYEHNSEAQFCSIARLLMKGK